MRIELELDDGEVPREHEILAERTENTVELVVDGHELEAEVTRDGDELVVELDGDRHTVQVDGDEAAIDGRRLAYRITSFSPGLGPGEAEHAVPPEGLVKPPMPGTIVDVLVAEGDEVEAGDVLATLEAMKMQSDIEAPRAGTVIAANVEAGEAVEDGQVLFEVGDGEER